MSDSEVLSEAEFDRLYRSFITKKPQDRNQGDTSTKWVVVKSRLQGLTNAQVAGSLDIDETRIRQYLTDAYRYFKIRSQQRKFDELQALFDRYQTIWQPEDRSATVTKIAEISTKFHNLPLRYCSQPIGREGDIDRIVKNITQHDLIWVQGMGGCGKTTTLLEVAHRCLNSAQNFEAIVYISAQTERLVNNARISLPAQRTRADIYRQIFETCNRGEVMYGSMAEAGSDEIDRHLHDALYQLLREYHTLLIFDNFDTLETYYTLRQVINRLPTSTRILVGSRHRFEDNYYIYSLDSLAPTDANILVKKLLQKRARQLRDREIKAIVKHTGGLPLAIEIVVGLVATQGKEAIDLAKFFIGNPLPQDLLNYCLDTAIDRLKKEPLQYEYQILKIIALFPDTAPKAALLAISQLNHIPSAFDRAIDRLVDLSLIIPVGIDRWKLHAIVHTYLNNILNSHPPTANHLRDRWVKWYLDRFANQYDDLNWQDWQDYHEIETEWYNLSAVVDWCFFSSPQFDRECLEFWHLLKGFTLFRGRWEERKQWLAWSIEIAELRGDRQTLALARYHQSLTIAYIDESDRDCHAIDLALAAWESGVDFGERFNLATYIASLHIRKQPEPNFVLARQWLESARSLSDNLSAVQLFQIKYYEAEIELLSNNLIGAELLYREAAKLALASKYRRFITYADGRIARILIHQGKLDDAETLLVNALNVLIENKDARATAFCQALLAVLKHHQQNHDGWMQWSQLAIASFKNLNMHREAAKLAAMSR